MAVVMSHADDVKEPVIIVARVGVLAVTPVNSHAMAVMEPGETRAVVVMVAITTSNAKNY